MAHDADDVAKVARLRPRAAASRSPSAPAAPASTARARATASSSTCAATSAASRSRTTARWRGSSPGTVLGHANRVLAPHGRKLGPDPASTDIATVGGVIANNSGGMRCGVDQGLLLDGALADLRAALGDDDRHRRAGRRRALRRGRAGAGRRASRAIRDEIRADAELSERIRRKFAIKNTTGYRLCAFLDADEPLEIFRRLLVGSEGTLAFVAEAVFETVPLPARTTTAWIHFPGIDEAIAPVRDLVDAGATRGRADGRPGADHRRLEHGRRARGVEGAAARVGGAAGRVRRRRRRRARRATSPARDEILAGHETDPPDRLHPRARGDRARLARARGPARADRPAAPAGHGADRRGRLRAAGADRRGAPATCRRCSASTASCPASPATPRPGTSTSCSPRTSPSRRTSSATRPSWRSWSS